MASKEMSLEDYEAENYRRANDGHVQPDLPPKPVEVPAVKPVPVVDEKKAV